MDRRIRWSRRIGARPEEMDRGNWWERLGKQRTGILHGAANELSRGEGQSGDRRGAGKIHGAGRRGARVHIRAAEDRKTFHAEVWKIRSADPHPERTRHVARVLDAWR